jgi:uncharacterized protein (DUF58 family)
LEFSEVREYMPGDNYRDIDWNVSARFGIPFIKKYQETRELNVVFIVDISGSQDFGTVGLFKRERLAEVAALLSFSALSNNDKVGVILWSDRLEKYMSARKGRNFALQIVRDILYLDPASKGTSLRGAFDYANRVLKKKSIIFVLSDFLDSGFQKPLQVLAQRHDVIALQLLDQAELELPDAGILRLVDPESGETIYLNSSKASVREQYKKYVIAEQQALKKHLQQLRVDLITIGSSDSYVRVLKNYFENRAKSYRFRR